MLNLEQVKLLENKVAKAIEYVERVNAENAALQSKLDSYQKRIDELEVVVLRFKEDQGRIEDGILSALDRLNRFESAIEKSLKEKAADHKAAAEKTASAAAPKPEKPAPHQAAAVEKAETAVKPAAKTPAPQTPKPAAPAQAAPPPASAGEMFFEIPEAEIDDDIADPLDGADLAGKSENGEELDIF
jgi:peptidoglycan hydrolase CwlO-like protein